jgi:hypothetical protein
MENLVIATVVLCVCALKMHNKRKNKPNDDGLDYKRFNTSDSIEFNGYPYITDNSDNGFEVIRFPGRVWINVTNRNKYLRYIDYCREEIIINFDEEDETLFSPNTKVFN